MTNPIGAALSRYSQELLSVLRMTSAFMFLQHGTQKMFGFPVEANAPYELLTLVPGLAGLLEVVGGLLLLVGFYTRPTAFVLSGMMAVAFWMAHAGPELFLWAVANRGEAAALYCFLFLYIAAAGGGKWSVDCLRSR